MRVEKRDLQSCTCMINWEDLDESYPTILKATLRELQNSWISLSNFWFCGKNGSEHHFISLHFIFKKGNIKTSTFPDFSLKNIFKKLSWRHKKTPLSGLDRSLYKKTLTKFYKKSCLIQFLLTKNKQSPNYKFWPLEYHWVNLLETVDLLKKCRM